MFVKRSLVGTAVAVLVVATGVAAYAEDEPTTAGDAPRGAKAVNDSHIEGKAVSIAPCRAVDTRNVGGKFANGETRTFSVIGGGSLAGQGGDASGCAVPSGAVAILATITSVESGGPGFIKAFSSSGSEPSTSFMNRSNTANLAVGGVIPIGPAFKVKNSSLNSPSTTHILVDVTGYIVKPMFASVNAAGGAIASSRVTGISHPSQGRYNVTFDRNVTGCAVMTSVSASQFGHAYKVVPAGSTVLIFRWNEAGSAQIDGDFYISVECK